MAAVDEAQFLDDGIVSVANDLADRGVRVIVAGTDMDFRGEPFGPMPQLLAIAERVDKLHPYASRAATLRLGTSGSSTESRHPQTDPPSK